jgi:hypothetical protein
MELEIVDLDFNDPVHCAAIVDVLDSYAADPAGGGAPLDPEARRRLVPGLREHPAAVVLLAIADRRPVGAAVCFRGFSTFQARLVLNAHDLAVTPAFRAGASDARCSPLSRRVPFASAVAGSRSRCRTTTAGRGPSTRASGSPISSSGPRAS